MEKHGAESFHADGGGGSEDGGLVGWVAHAIKAREFKWDGS
jgi:hypothetical protein